MKVNAINQDFFPSSILVEILDLKIKIHLFEIGK